MKTWDVIRLEAGQAGIQCPYASCRGKAVVNRKKWLSANSFKTRSCTYCFKTSLLPSGLMEKK